MKKSLLIIVLATYSFCSAQDSNMKEAFAFEDKIKNELITKKYLKYSFNKNKEHYQYESVAFILIYKDSLVYRVFEKNSNNETIVKEKTILNNEAIDYTNLYFDLFSDYSPKCSNNEFFSDGLVNPPPNFKDKYIDYSKNQWSIKSATYNEDGNWNYEFSFKSKLLKLKCLGLFKNLKSRKKFRKLLKYMNKDYESKNLALKDTTNIFLHESIHSQKQ